MRKIFSPIRTRRWRRSRLQLGSRTKVIAHVVSGSMSASRRAAIAGQCVNRRGKSESDDRIGAQFLDLTSMFRDELRATPHREAPANGPARSGDGTTSLRFALEFPLVVVANSDATCVRQHLHHAEPILVNFGDRNPLSPMRSLPQPLGDAYARCPSMAASSRGCETAQPLQIAPAP
jgi:hypothetical protein